MQFSNKVVNLDWLPSAKMFLSSGFQPGICDHQRGLETFLEDHE